MAVYREPSLLDSNRPVDVYGLRLPCIYRLHIRGPSGEAVRELLLGQLLQQLPAAANRARGLYH